MDRRDEVTVQFMTALNDCFKDEEERQSEAFSPIDLDEINANDLILAMFFATMHIVKHLTNLEGDPLDFVNVITHLLFQDEKGKLSEKIEED
jgi:hypothetical protein